MEGIPSPKKPGAARAGVLVGALLLALLLLLPGIWYARYHDQLAMTVRTFPRPGAVPTRPSGLISLPPPGPGRNRTVQIRHKGGQVVTTVNDGNLTITARTTDPLPPSNPLDALGQDLCDRYNAWKCARGDSSQPSYVFTGAGRGPMTMQMHGALPFTLPPVAISRLKRIPAPAHAPGTHAP